MVSIANVKMETAEAKAAVTGTSWVIKDLTKRDFLISVVQMQF